MKLWIASANKAEIIKSYTFPITGIITNPTVLALENNKWDDIIRTLNKIGSDPIHLQILSTEKDEMMKEFLAFKSLVTDKPLIAKIPICKDGIEIIPTIKKMGHEVNITAICTLNQAVVALEADVEYLSVYVARVTDSGGDGIRLVSEIREYIDKTGKKTEIIAASVRNVEQMEQVINVGVHGIAISYPLLIDSIQSLVTDKSIEKFAVDWTKIV